MLTRYYRIEPADEDMPVFRVWRGTATNDQVFDGGYTVPVFGPASHQMCAEFVRLLVSGDVVTESAARHWAIEHAGLVSA